MIAPLARRHDAAPGQRDASRCRASRPTSSTTRGESVPLGGGGYVVLTRPWPGMLRGIWGDDERYRQTYWSKFPHRVLRRRRLPARSRRQLLVHGTHRRRDERQRPPHLDDRSRERAGRSSEGRRGGRLRQTRRHDRPGHLRVRHAQGRGDRLARVRRRAARPRRRRSSASSHARSTSRSRKSCPRREAARSCAASCATSPKDERSATRRRSPTRRSSTSFRNARSGSRSGRVKNACQLLQVQRSASRREATPDRIVSP